MKLLFLFFFPLPLVYAEDSKRIDVDLDVNSTVIVKADVDQEDMYYYIDTNACICALRIYDKHLSGLATVDCAKLAAHKKLTKYVKKCIPKPKKMQALAPPPIVPTAKVEAAAETAAKPAEDKKAEDAQKESEN